MEKTKSSSLKRDIILISIVSLIVLTILIFSLVTRKPKDYAYIKFNDNTLFVVNLDNGKYETYTTYYVVNSMPEIIDEMLIIDGVSDERLEEGKGVIIYKNHFYIMGHLGFIHIEYSSEKKMIRVAKEKSPYKICSGLGYSNGTPIICLPNLVTIVFDDDVDILI